MKTKRILKIMIIFVLYLLLNITISNAASLSIKAAKTTAKKGETVTITVNGSGLTGKVSLAVSGKGSLNSNSVWVENSSKTVKLSINGTGKITVTAKPIDVSDSDNATAYTKSASTTITVKDTSTSNTTNNNTNNTDNNNTTTSSDATLSNLGIRPNDFGGFRKANTSYSVSVPKNVDKISIYATPSNSKATVTGTGSKSLQIGKNTFNIKVTAEDKKTTKTYTLTITRKSEEVSSDATLKNLGIRPKEYDFTGFKPTVTSYNVSVPNDTEKITIYATAKNEKDTITGIGTKTLNVGQNKCEIKVTSEDKKTTKTYTINVTRKEEKEDDEEEKEEETPVVSGVKDIIIKDAELTPSFSQDVFSYDVSVPIGTKKLDIDTEKTSEDIEVEIAGNEDLKEGDNIITLLVHNTRNDATSTYQINAKVENQKVDLSTINDELKDAKNNSNMKEWIIKGVAIAIIVLIIIFLIYRFMINRKQDDEEEDYDEDEQDYIGNDKNTYYESDDDNQYYEPNADNQFEEEEKPKYTSTASEEIRNIGLFDTQRIEYEDYKENKKHGKYKGRRFK